MLKLVRNYVPAKMREQGTACNYATAENAELYTDLLRAKLVEEVNEFLYSNSVDELVDICTVVEAILSDLKIKEDEFKKLYTDKLSLNGGFDKKYFIILPDAPQYPVENQNK